jgi:MFS family permease
MNSINNSIKSDVEKTGYFRWVIVALIFLATTINYVDRQVIGILAPTLQKEIGWSDIEYGYIVTAFTAAYALGLPLLGKLIDVIGPPLIVIYLMADVGSVGGGWLSSFFIKRGWSINKGRKVTMLICAVSVIPIMFASQVSNIWIAVALLSLATAAHQGWSANLFTTVSDIFPRKAVASVVGLGGTFGAIGGMLIATAAGFILEFTGSYLILFVIAGSLYLIALFVINLLVPDIKEIEMQG